MNRPEIMLHNLEFVERKEPQEILMEDIGYQSLLEREVLFRRLTPAASGNPKLRYGFIQEARLLATLRHPNLAQVYDAGYDENGLVYMVLEKPKGISLQHRLDLLNSQRERVKLGEVEEIVYGISRGVEHIHQHHALVHDVSPSNIVLTVDGRPVLVGLGQPLPEDISAATPEALAYAAPERLLGGHVDQQSDIYALGVLVYHLLCGRLPFEGNPLGIISQKQHGDCLPGLETASAEWPSALVPVLRQATARQSGQRYENVAAFRTALLRALSSWSVEQLQPTLVTAMDNGYNGYNNHNGSNGHNGHYSQNGHNGYNGHNGHNGYNGHNGHHNGVDKPNKIGAIDNLAGTLPPVHITAAATNGKPASKSYTSEARPSPAAEPAGKKESADPVEEIKSAIGSEATAVNPLAISLLSADIDPLMPGRDNPALQAALPFTTLVPMPAPVEAVAAAPIPVIPEPAKTPLIRAWMVWTSLLGLLATITALKFG